MPNLTPPGDARHDCLCEQLWRIPAMDCATEENEIRQALAGLAGICELRFQLTSRTLLIRAEPEALSQAAAIVRILGYPPPGAGGKPGGLAASRDGALDAPDRCPHSGGGR